MCNIDFNIIRSYLDDKLKCHIERTLLDNLFDKLIVNNVPTVLAYNLYSDFKNGYLEPQQFSKIVNSLSNYENEFFSEYIGNNQDAFLCQSLLGPQQILNDQTFVRILRLIELKRGFRKTLRVLTDSEAESEILDRFFNDSQENESFELYRGEWRGKWNIVWVLSKHEYDQIKVDENHNNWAKVFRDRLGLHNKSGKFVSIIYPIGFNETDSYKPTSFDAPSYYLFLTIRSDNSWGLTYSLDKTKPGIAERVHKKLNSLTNDFKGEKLGEILEDTIFDANEFISEAIRRAKL